MNDIVAEVGRSTVSLVVEDHNGFAQEDAQEIVYFQMRQ
jgi:hypothetical protein